MDNVGPSSLESQPATIVNGNIAAAVHIRRQTCELCGIKVISSNARGIRIHCRKHHPDWTIDYVRCGQHFKDNADSTRHCDEHHRQNDRMVIQKDVVGEQRSRATTAINEDKKPVSGQQFDVMIKKGSIAPMKMNYVLTPRRFKSRKVVVEDEGGCERRLPPSTMACTQIKKKRTKSWSSKVKKETTTADDGRARTSVLFQLRYKYCMACQCRFATGSALAQHIVIHGVFVCLVCGKEMSNDVAFRDHQQEHHCSTEDNDNPDEITLQRDNTKTDSHRMKTEND